MNAVEPTPPIGRWRRIRKWLVQFGLLILVILALVAGGVFWHWTRSNSELEQAIAETDALDPEWRQMNAASLPSNTNDDVVRRIQALTAKLPIHIPDRGFDFPSLSAPHRLQPDAIEQLMAWLGPAGGILPEVRALATVPQAKLDAGLGSYMNYTPFPIHSRLLNILIADCLNETEAGHSETAVGSWQAYWLVSRSISREPLGTRARLRRQVTGICLLQRLLAQSELDESTLADLQRLVTDDDRAVLFQRAARASRAQAYQMLELLKQRELTQTLSLLRSRSITISDAVANTPISLSTQQALALRAGNRLLEITQLPPEEWLTRISALSSELLQRPTITAELLQPTAQSFSFFQRGHAEFRVTIAGLAAERFRINNARWPGSFDELVASGFLKTVPTDPFDGKLLKFKTREDGLIIYSVGFDKTDNGGNLGSTYDGYDFGIRLWDATRRRQPPSKKGEPR